MRAAVLEDVGQLIVKDAPRPEPDAGGVVVRTEACAVCTTDVKIFRHGYSGFRPPLILGHEMSGTIDCVGPGVTAWREGDRVAVGPNIACGRCWFCRAGIPTACDDLKTIGVHIDGGFAEYVHVPAEAVAADCLIRIPEGVSFEQATLVDPLSCAVNAAELSNIREGDVVVVIGAGPTGCLNVEVARSLGAKVILVQRSVQRLENARFTGADVYVSPVNDDVKSRVMEETQRRGADVVIVACNSAQAQAESLELARKRGNVNFFGGLPKDSPTVELNTNLIHYSEIFVTGTHGGSSEHCRKALSLIGDGKIKADNYLTHRFALAELIAGIETVENKQGLKTIIATQGDDR